MKLYKGKFLTISYEEENELFTQYWHRSPKTTEDFKQEMLVFLSYCKKITPKLVLWLQEHFTFEPDLETQLWIEEQINVPAKALGNEKCAFVVSKNLLAHLAVIETFENTNSCIHPEHFATIEEAKKWLFEKRENPKPELSSIVIFEGVNERGNPTFSLQSQDSYLIKESIKSFKHLRINLKLAQTGKEKYESLTKREKEILYWIGKDLVNQQIADKLFISKHTVRTHRNRIWEKLDISSKQEAINFSRSFTY